MSLLLQGCQSSGVQDLHVALLLLLVSRVVKDEAALTEAGGPSFFVDLLEDDDACIRHAAATFLEVGLLPHSCTQAARPPCKCHKECWLPCNLQVQAASRWDSFPVCTYSWLGAMTEACINASLL